MLEKYKSEISIKNKGYSTRVALVFFEMDL